MTQRAIPTPHTPTTFFLPADDVRAAFQCVSDERTRYYLNGVFCTRTELVGLDGHQMLQVALPETIHVGAECDTQPGGFLLLADHTDKAWKARTKGDLWIYGDVSTGLLQFVDRHGKYQPGEPCLRVGVTEFTRIDGTFPDYTRVVAKGAGECGSFSYAPAVMSKLLKAASVLSTVKGGPAVRITTGATGGDPARVDFAGLPRLRGTIMPYRWPE
jgi:hypothetical protein